MPQINMPENWEPPYLSWSAEYAADVELIVIAYIAVQSKGESTAGFHDWFKGALSINHAPQIVDRAAYLDTERFNNEVYICYWTDYSDYHRWVSSDTVSLWWNHDTRQSGSSGYWWETLNIPMGRFETIFSSEDAAGAASTTDKFIGPIQEHAYWGAMRDRIPSSAANAFDNTTGSELSPVRGQDSIGKRLMVTPPENMCVIRSAQNWTECQGEELMIYLNDVHPVLKKGMEFIRDNSVETGCISCRFMDELTMEGKSQDKTFGQAYFLTMGHLEAWAKSHPTHLAIFGSFHQMVKKLNFELDLKLWHEVSVVSNQNEPFAYVNCHPNTGLLPFFTASRC